MRESFNSQLFIGFYGCRSCILRNFEIRNSGLKTDFIIAFLQNDSTLIICCRFHISLYRIRTCRLQKFFIRFQIGIGGTCKFYTLSADIFTTAYKNIDTFYRLSVVKGYPADNLPGGRPESDGFRLSGTLYRFIGTFG